MLGFAMTCGDRHAGVVQFADGHSVLLPSNAGLGILKVLERGVDVALKEKAAREASSVSDFEGQLAGKFAGEAGIEDIRIRRLQIGSDAHEFAGDGGDVGRSDREGFRLAGGVSTGAAPV